MQKLREDSFELVLLDVMMPDGRGINLLKPINEIDPDIVSVIITGCATVELAVEAIKQGAYDLIPKMLIPISLAPEIRRALDQFSVQAEKKAIASSLEAPDKDVLVQATEDSLTKIFNNLIGNAIKYTPEGGRVEVAVSEKPNGVVCTVSDSGIGIPEEDLPHLCEEFFRARNVRKSGIVGTGLGLSIVKQQLDRFGGEIEVHNTEGVGTTFTLHFRAAHPGGPDESI